MFKQKLNYFKFLLKSTNQHGVQSPFVYRFITNCFYNKLAQEILTKLESYRQSLLNNKEIIEITDLGAGSHRLKTTTRIVSDIAKRAGTSPKRAKVLYQIITYFNCKNILELGTSLGIATYAMHLADNDAQITTIEGCPNTANFTKNQFNKFKAQNITSLTGNFEDVLKTLAEKPLDFIFFDGNHQKEATLKYFKTMLPKTHNDSIFIFDDIHWSEGMTEAWQIIKEHPQVTVTIDTFHWGIVFFRTEQVKEHFTIRM